MKHIILLAIIIFYSCTTTTQKLDVNTKYRMDIKMTTNGKSYVGTAVFPKRQIYNIHFESPGTMSLFRLTTCARDFYVEQESGKILDRKETTIQFAPSLIEQRGGCVASIGAYEKILGRHASAMFDWQDDVSTLPARVTCNGNAYRSEGVTLCQSKIGVLQRLDFDVPVFTKSDCLIEEDGEQAFEWGMVIGTCSYVIQEAVEPFRQHRITTWGYQKIPLRGE